MPIRVLISDYHGTLTKDRDESDLWRYMGTRMMTSSLSNPRQLAELFHQFSYFSGLVRKYKEGRIGYDSIYEVFNDRILSRVPPEDVFGYADAYAKIAASKKLDLDTLRIIQDHDSQKFILSAGLGYGIKRTLEEAGFGRTFNEIFANRLNGQRNGGSAFELKIKGNKYLVLKTIADERRINLKETAYMGDTEEDEPCLELAGYTVIPRLASEPFKEKWARKGSYVVENYSDFSRYLSKA